MWVKIVPSNELRHSPSWKPEFFCSEGISTRGSRFPMVSLRSIVRERGEPVDPQDRAFHQLPYVGLENVEPVTGRLLNVKSCASANVISRSKRFAPEDVLYGRLRPALNKVCLLYTSDAADDLLCVDLGGRRI